MLKKQKVLNNYIKHNFNLYLKYKFLRYNTRNLNKIINQLPSTLFLYNKNLFIYNLVFFLLYNNVFGELFLKKHRKLQTWKNSKIINFYIFLKKYLIKNITLHFYKVFFYINNKILTKEYTLLNKNIKKYKEFSVNNIKYLEKYKYSFFLDYTYNPLYFLKIFLIQKIYLKYVFV